MRVLLNAVLYTLVFVFLSCSKEKKAVSDEEQPSSYTASYSGVFTIAKGSGFTSSPMQHDFPAGVRFSINDVRNVSDKTVSGFLNKYQVGVWDQPVNKASDLTEAAVIAKYRRVEKSGITIHPETGVITIEGKATEVIPAGTYYVLVEALTNNHTVYLYKVARIEISEIGAIPVKATWKYANEGSTTPASVTVKKLTGTLLSETSTTIPNFSAAKTYIRLKIADGRNKGIGILKDVSWQTNFSPGTINPWVAAVPAGDAILLSSPIDRFPVLAGDSVIKGSVKSSLIVNKVDVNFEIALNVLGEGVYDVVVQMNNHSSQNALWWPEGKTVYMPTLLRSNNFLSNDSQWSYERMDWSDNFVVFWQKGFGADPSVSATRKVDIKSMLQNLERQYKFYYDTMKFVKAGSSKTDINRTMIMLNDQADWLATGSGYDSQTGAMWINYNAANSTATLAHELAHTFQYLNNCDGNYAFTGNYNYIGLIWEQSAQYQTTLLYPTAYFNYIPTFVPTTHLNLLHEDNRYSNFYHLQYWQLLHGIEFAGKLWRQAVVAEDAVEAYKRITGISQSQFNDEMYDYARRTLNWNFLHKSSYTSYILPSSALNSHNSKVNLQSDNYYLIDPTKCVQNYGFNALQLNIPAAGTVVKASFQGLKGISGFNTTYDQYAGWRWGMVAITSSGDAVYSAMNSSGSGDISFTIPANTSRLYFLVIGAPTQHFHHVWDDIPANDEQYPWKAKFENTQPKS